MSVATLRRRLASRNSRFRDLRDQVLATDALMLIQAGQSVEAVAEPEAKPGEGQDAERRSSVRKCRHEGVQVGLATLGVCREVVAPPCPCKERS